MNIKTNYLFTAKEIKMMSLSKMVAKGITIHNTANTAPANNEARNMFNNNTKKGTGGVAVHYFVDDFETYQMLPLNIHGWHASDGWHAIDGNGFGNMQTIAIEICASKDYYTDRYEKAELRTVELVKYLMKQHNIPINKVKRHHDYCRYKQKCPHRMFEAKPNTWEQFIKLVENKTPEPPRPNDKEKYKVGDKVDFDKIANMSTSGAKITNAYYKTGVISKVYGNRTYPYLINDYLGFLNDDMIITKPKPKPAAGLKVGDKVKIKNSAYRYATGQIIGKQYKNKPYTIMQLRPNEALLKELYSWVFTKDVSK